MDGGLETQKFETIANAEKSCLIPDGNWNTMSPRGTESAPNSQANCKPRFDVPRVIA
jgi:hypothetical protein